MRHYAPLVIGLLAACSGKPRRDWSAELAQCGVVSKTTDDLRRCLAIDRRRPAESVVSVATRFHLPVDHHHVRDLRQCYAGKPLTGDASIAQAAIERCLTSEHDWDNGPAANAAARYSLFMLT